MRVPDVVALSVQPWADLYASSSLVSTTVQFLHLSGLLVAGGFALAFDRAALRTTAAPLVERASFLRELRAVHTPVLLALIVVTTSGLALMLADIETMLPSRVFWVKMAAFALLLVNGLAIRAIAGRLRCNANDGKAWRALRAGSVRSVSLWIATVFLGVLLTAAA